MDELRKLIANNKPTVPNASIGGAGPHVHNSPASNLPLYGPGGSAVFTPAFGTMPMASYGVDAPRVPMPAGGVFAPLDIDLGNHGYSPTGHPNAHAPGSVTGSAPGTPHPQVNASAPVTAITGGGERPTGFLSSRLGRYALLAALVAALVFTMRTVSTLLARRRPDANPMQGFETGQEEDEDDEAGSDGASNATADEPESDIEAPPPSPPRKRRSRKPRHKKAEKPKAEKPKAELFTIPDDDDSDASPRTPATSAKTGASAPEPPQDPMFLPLARDKA
jgi:hypothetical protein